MVLSPRLHSMYSHAAYCRHNRTTMSLAFQYQDPSLETQWRAILLFGRNVASYKFALASALLEIGPSPNDLVLLEDLAVPYAQHLCRHLQEADKQATSSTSRFLHACRSYNLGTISSDQLRSKTVQLGFQNVIAAFHVVGGAEVSNRFFLDERPDNRGIRITEDFYRLLEAAQAANLPHETEARWRLVETAWELNLPTHSLHVVRDGATETLHAAKGFRRKNITRTQPALNGYQKGRCFYCFRDMTLEVGSSVEADVDHFLPHTLAQHLPASLGPMIDGMWNLVLACPDCNRGIGGKFDRLPSTPLLSRLHRRNEFLISSHHPLRETLILQTGTSVSARQDFLVDAYKEARILRPTAPWEPLISAAPVF